MYYLACHFGQSSNLAHGKSLKAVLQNACMFVLRVKNIQPIVAFLFKLLYIESRKCQKPETWNFKFEPALQHRLKSLQRETAKIRTVSASINI